MKKFAIVLAASFMCCLFMGAIAPYDAPLNAAVSAESGITGSSIGKLSFLGGLILIILVVIRGWFINRGTRKRHVESNRVYTYMPSSTRLDELERLSALRNRSALEDMDFPSGFGGIHDMQQLERNRALYKLYSEITENRDGWDDARR